MARSPQRCKEQRERMREKILTQAAPYFARHGFFGVRMGELARSIGIAPGTIYLYFPSKEALLQELFRPVEEEDLPALAELMGQGGPAGSRLLALSQGILGRMEADPVFSARIELMDQVLRSQGKLAQRCRQAWDRLCQCIGALIAQAQGEGSAVPGDPLELAGLYWGMVFLSARRKLASSQGAGADPYPLARCLLRDKALEELGWESKMQIPFPPGP